MEKTVEILVSSFLAFHSKLAAGEADSQRMRPRVAKAIFDPRFANDDVFFELIRSIQADPRRRIQISVDGCRTDRDEQHFVSSSVDVSGTLENWLDRTFAGRRYRIVINGAEQWSDAIARQVCRIFRPIIAAGGTQDIIFETVLVIGNDGVAPSGIRAAERFTTLFQFNLGVGEQIVTVFDREEFSRRAGEKECSFDVAEMVPYGRSFRLQPGHVLLIPSDYFRTTDMPDFSIQLGVVISWAPEKLLQDVLGSAIRAKWMQSDIRTVLTRAAQYGGNSGALTEWIARSKEEYELALHSNNQFRNRFAVAPRTVVKEQTVLRRDNEFGIKVVKRHDEIVAFARGNRIKLAPTAHSEHVLSVVFERATIGPSDVCRAVNSEISKEAAFAILSKFVHCGGLVSAESTADEP